MNETPAEIDRIVRQVLAALRAAENGNGAEEKVAENRSSWAKPQTSGGRVCVVAERVVTWAGLKDALNDAAVVRVGCGAIVTPAARDELKARNIRLEFAEQASTVAAAMRVMVGVGDAPVEPSAAAKAVQNHLAGVAETQFIQELELPALVRQVGQQVVQENALGVVLTARPAAAAGLANRLPGVRAAWGCSVPAVSDAARTFAVNLLTFNPGKHALFEQRAMLREFVRHGVPECPPEFQDPRS